jgi:hypothetical protein
MIITKYNMKITEIVVGKTSAPVRTEMTAGASGAGAVATSTGDGNGFGQSIFYKKSQTIKKAKKK